MRSTNLAPWINGLQVQVRVVHALMIRAAMGHHGHHNLGFFWIIGEPLFLMGGVMIIWSFANITHGSDIGVVPFTLTGYAFITLWRHISGQAVHIMRNNSSLQYHIHVSWIDNLIAKALLETIALFTAFIVCYVPFYLFGVCPSIHDPLWLVFGFVFTGWFSFGVALVIAAASEISSIAKNTVGAVMYITLPLTGAFTMQEWIPSQARFFLSWSPLVNCVEMIRGGLFPSEVPTHFSAAYVLVCCLVISAVGFHAARLAQRSVEN